MPSVTGGEPGESHLAGITPCGARGRDRYKPRVGGRGRKRQDVLEQQKHKPMRTYTGINKTPHCRDTEVVNARIHKLRHATSNPEGAEVHPCLPQQHEGTVCISTVS